MKLVISLLIVAGLGSVANADEQKSGRYVSVSGGLNVLGDETLDVNIGSNFGSGEASFDSSFAGGGAVGYRFGNNFSVEGEFLYRRAELDTVDLGDVGQFSDGDFANTQINLNVYYHFNLTGDSRIETYVGAGLAYINEVDIDLESNGVENEFESDEFGVELMGGARYHLWDRGFLDVGVRYLPLGGLDLKRSDGSADTIKADYSPFMATVKFGWRF